MAAVAISVALHAAAVSVALWPARQRASHIVVVALVGAGDPSAIAQSATSAPALGAAPPTAGDATAADAEDLGAGRDALASQLDAESAARDELRGQVGALTAENHVLAGELAEAHGRIERLEDALAARRAVEYAMYEELVAALRQEIAGKDVELRRDWRARSFARRTATPCREPDRVSSSGFPLTRVRCTLAAPIAWHTLCSSLRSDSV